jgi:hypothetical protein
VIRYLLDSSALWRILRDASLRASWAEVISLGVIGSCQPQRVEFRRSARTLDEYEQMSEMFGALYPDAVTPKTAGGGLSRHNTACCGMAPIGHGQPLTC